MNNPLRTCHNSGQVTRWHAHPIMCRHFQSVADHTWGMVALLYKMHPNPSTELVKAIIYHDSGELFGGDLQYGFKKSHPEFAAQHEQMSSDLARQAGIPQVVVTGNDAEWLEFLDRLESWFFVLLHEPELLADLAWQSMKNYLIAKARELGCYALARLDEIIK